MAKNINKKFMIDFRIFEFLQSLRIIPLTYYYTIHIQMYERVHDKHLKVSNFIITGC